MAFFDSAGVQIHYEEYGSGDPVVLVHGFASNAQHNWGSTGWFELLKPHFRVVALDCRGHGQSGKPHDAAAYSDPAMEDDVIRLMDHLHIQRALLVGYSMGGRISMGLLVNHPERLRGVVLGGIGGGAQMRDPARQKAISDALLADDDSQVAAELPKQFRMFAKSVGNDLKALAACMLAQREAVGPAELGRIKLPVLLAIGSKDDLVGSARPLKDAIPGAKLVEIEGRDHIAAPGDKRYQAAVLEFLKSVPK
jgi:pimeloyl-ACP methyl ester carboxylesterase